MGYIGYFVLGFFLNGIAVTRRVILISASVFVVSLIFTFFAIYIGMQSPKYDQFYEQYLSLNVILMSASAFVLLKGADQNIPRAVGRWLIPLGGTAFGIYLLHVIVMDLFSKYLAPNLPILQSGHTLVVMPIVAVITFLVCLVVIWLVQRIPLLKHLVP